MVPKGNPKSIKSLEDLTSSHVTFINRQRGSGTRILLDYKLKGLGITKDAIRETLGWIGINRFKDYHTWHPTYVILLKLITANDFEVQDSYWQPYWKDQVVYVLASKC